MMKSLRTYHAFRLAAAVVLVFGTTLPFVEYACAMSGRQASMSPALASAPASGVAAVNAVPAEVLGMLCADMPCCGGATCMVQCEESCAVDGAGASDDCGDCITETVLDGDATVPQKIDAAQSLILTWFFLPVESGTVSSVSEPVTHPRESPGPPGYTPPLRVLYACFLL